MNPIIRKLRSFYGLAFPTKQIEWILFSVFWSLFSCIGYIIATRYTLIFDHRIPWDAYFSFDNRAIVLTGGGFERHPLANYFFDVLRRIALWFSDGKYDAVFRFVLAIFSAMAMAFSILYVFKYLTFIIGLGRYKAVLLTMFFSLFSTTLVLAFTPETYTYTQPALLLFLLYVSRQMQNGKRLSGLALSLGAVSIGGLTITNATKVFLPVVLELHLWSNGKRFLHALGRVALSVSIFVGLFLYRMNFNYQQILSKTEAQYEKFSQPKFTPLWDMVLSWFAGGTMLFPSFFVRDYYSKTGFEYKALFMDTYSSIAQYVWVVLIGVCIIWTVIKQVKNKWVYVLLLWGTVDIVIHILLKFGLHTAYIYGGHYVFLVPLFLGWLLASYPRENAWQKSIISVYVILMFFLLLNTVYRGIELYQFMEKYYKVSF